ncbi:Putative transmembrane protein [Rubrivivax sp. A210]|uniref:DMT family transporter n=1 Tax=Rubrivivax sp. A210 TaxID=2772301 RepID=UPI00198F8A03|nr:DMT family transporter [Rubrivivax sp. A210]CAD5372880.1 Putative transmembrane protein [Rubrivivax sp. A210]
MTGAGGGAALPLRAMPAVFVLIWSTGFVVARYGMPHAPPLTFLSWRYALSIAAFGVWIALARATWPQGRRQWGHLAVTGMLMHGGYLGGVWVAVKLGLGAGLTALVVGLQPLITALWISARGHAHHVSRTQWLGLVLGLAGLVLVVWHKLGVGEAAPLTIACALFALASITAGTLYQKRWVARCDVRTANTVQLLAALAITLPLSLFESGGMVWHPQLIGALAWSVLVLTLGGSSLLYMLIQRGAATAVTSLMYLVPPCTALFAWMLFGETLGAAVLTGLVLAAAGVALVVRAAQPASRPS